MYDFVDRPVTDLDHGGRFLVWSMRSWVTALTDRKCPGHRVAAAFAKWTMLPGFRPFLRVMAILNGHGLRTFRYCALGCNHVAEDEAVLISLICSLQDQRPEMVHAIVGHLVEEEVAADFILALSGLGRAMDAAGIFPGRQPGRSSSQPVERR